MIEVATAPPPAAEQARPSLTEVLDAAKDARTEAKAKRTAERAQAKKDAVAERARIKAAAEQANAPTERQLQEKLGAEQAKDTERQLRADEKAEAKTRRRETYKKVGERLTQIKDIVVLGTTSKEARKAIFDAAKDKLRAKYEDITEEANYRGDYLRGEYEANQRAKSSVGADILTGVVLAPKLGAAGAELGVAKAQEHWKKAADYLRPRRDALREAFRTGRETYRTRVGEHTAATARDNRESVPQLREASIAIRPSTRREISRAA